jgi:hypothetical protein
MHHCRLLYAPMRLKTTYDEIYLETFIATIVPGRGDFGKNCWMRLGFSSPPWHLSAHLSTKKPIIPILPRNNTRVSECSDNCFNWLHSAARTGHGMHNRSALRSELLAIPPPLDTLGRLPYLVSPYTAVRRLNRALPIVSTHARCF